MNLLIVNQLIAFKLVTSYLDSFLYSVQAYEQHWNDGLLLSSLL